MAHRGRCIEEENTAIEIIQKDSSIDDTTLNEKHAKRSKLDNIPLEIITETVNFLNEKNVISDVPKTCKFLFLAATTAMKHKRSLKIKLDEEKIEKIIGNIETLKSQNAIHSIQDVYLSFASEQIIENAKEVKDIVKLLRLFQTYKPLKLMLSLPNLLHIGSILQKIYLGI